MTPRIVAIIVAYYPQRIGNVVQSARAILSGSVVPDELTILNNNPGVVLPFIEGAKVVNAWNTWTRGKYGAALLSPADYYLLLDDDITVKPKTLERLLKSANSECFISGEGGILALGDRPVSSRQKIWPEEISHETVVDISVGQLQFLSMTAILRMFALEPEVRLRGEQFLHEAEDLLCGLANRCTVVSMRKEDESPLYLDECGVCLPQFVKDYGQMRDRFVLKVLDILKMKNYPWLSDAPWRIARGI